MACGRRAGRFLPLLAACCLLLSGCTALLERSYSVVEPYTDRYWDSKDTLRAESYQDLVNSLLMLVEQRTEEGVIRCYEEADSYQQALAAQKEVREETTLGSYLLSGLTFSYEAGPSYGTLTYRMTYREDTFDMDNIMTLSDSQSLVDLLRLTVREERESLTAQFAYDTPREDVIAAVESLWQELCAGEEEAAAEAVLSSEELPTDGEAETDPVPEAETETEAAPEAEPESEPEPAPEPAASGGDPASGDDPASGSDPPAIDPVPEEPICPPCPWTIRFYPDKEMIAIVEILLTAP